MRLPLAVLLLAIIIVPATFAADPAPTVDYSRGEKMIEGYFRKQVHQIADDCLKEYKTKEQWEKARPELRRQFLEMVGLWPLPAKTDLKPQITGIVDMPKYTIEKVAFQSWPNLYVTAHVYVPKPAPKNAPAILYLCGHGNVVKKIDGMDVSFGSKTYYQRHPAWFAQHGYVAMVLDTLQLSEIPGIHHGTYRFGMWWWQTLGYTPAGVECWNAMRALDYLETRPEVDRTKIGVTGRSGGGASSWWIAAADDRPKCIIPVAGIADLQAHLNEGYPGRLEKGVIAGHCDCMFMVNSYRWDFPMVAALCAPRPLMLGNSDKDDIFPVPSYRRLANKVRTIYELYGASDKFVLLETHGPHVDTPELRVPAFRWMNRWLKNDNAEVKDEPFEPLPPEKLKVLDKPPEGNINATLHDYFIKPAKLELPQSASVVKQWWQGQKPILEKVLTEKVFRGWTKNPPDLGVKLASDRSANGMRFRAYDFTSEEGIELRLWLMTAASNQTPKLVVLNALDEPGWQEWCEDLGPAFTEALQLPKPVKINESKFRQNQRAMEAQKWAFAAICPRGVGPTRWAKDGSMNDIQIRRRFALVGQTLDGQRVWDVRRGLAVLGQIPDLKGASLSLQGKQDMAGIVLYASLFEPDVKGLDLWNLPASHKESPIFLNVRRYFDTPQALALAFPKTIRIHVKSLEEAKQWNWPTQLQKALGEEHLTIRE